MWLPLAELGQANIRLSPRINRLLRLLVVTPNMHKVHHSRDRRETDAADFHKLSYGLNGFDVKERQTLCGLLKMPLVTYDRV